MENKFEFSMPQGCIATGYPHSNIDEIWGPYASVEDALTMFANQVDSREPGVPAGTKISFIQPGQKFGVITSQEYGGNTTYTIEEYMFTGTSASDYKKLVLTDNDVNEIRGFYSYDPDDTDTGNTRHQDLAAAFSANKIITVDGNFANVTLNAQSNTYTIKYIDTNGTIHNIEDSASGVSIGTSVALDQSSALADKLSKPSNVQVDENYVLTGTQYGVTWTAENVSSTWYSESGYEPASYVSQ